METSQDKPLHDLPSSMHTVEELSQRLATVAKELQTAGALASDTVIDGMTAPCRSFKELRDKALEIVDVLAGSSPTAPTAAGSVKELEALLQFATEAQRKKVQEEKARLRALTILDRILSLIHRDRPEFPPLYEAQVKAKAIQESLRTQEGPDVHSTINLLAQGRHPFAELLTLIEGHHDLEDDLWLLLTHAVEEHFGKSLAMSAARGKLCTATTRIAIDNSSADH